MSTFLALGDSYTIGEGVSESDRWPTLLSVRLQAIGIPMQAPRIVAKTGWTTEELSAAVGRERLTDHFDLVTLLAGVNDQFRGLGLDAYRSSFDRLLRQALRLAKLPSHLIVLSIPDWSVTPFAAGRNRAQIARKIDAFNDANHDVTRSNGGRYVDITPASRRALKNDELLAADGLHPSAAMYHAWLDILFPVVRDVLIPETTTDHGVPD